MLAVTCRPAEDLPDPGSNGTRLRDLSTHDKREVATLAAAGLASAVSVLAIGTLLMTPGPLLTARPLAPFVAAAPAAPVSLAVAARRARNAIRRNAHTLAAPRLALASARPVEATAPSMPVRSSIQMANADLPSAYGRRGPGTLRRVFFGSGQYRVQPFPTASEQ